MAHAQDIPKPLEGDLPYFDDVEHQDRIERDLLETPLGDLATDDFVVVAPDCTVRETIDRFAGSGNHCAVVVDNGTLLGIFTERDILCKVADDFAAHADAPVRAYMTPSPETLEAHIPVVFGLNRMTVGGYRHIPITENGELRGLVSTRNIFAFIVERLPHTRNANATPAHS